MRTLIKKEKGLEHEIEVDSAGILSYHRGNCRQPYADTCFRQRLQSDHRSRPVCTEDFYHFDMIIGMDDRNIEDLMERARNLKLETEKNPSLTDYLLPRQGGRLCSGDPYYGGARVRER